MKGWCWWYSLWDGQTLTWVPIRYSTACWLGQLHRFSASVLVFSRTSDWVSLSGFTHLPEICSGFLLEIVFRSEVEWRVCANPCLLIRICHLWYTRSAWCYVCVGDQCVEVSMLHLRRREGSWRKHRGKFGYKTTHSVSFRSPYSSGDNDKHTCEARLKVRAVVFVLCGAFIIPVRTKCVGPLQNTSSVSPHNPSSHLY